MRQQSSQNCSLVSLCVTTCYDTLAALFIRWSVETKSLDHLVCWKRFFVFPCPFCYMLLANECRTTKTLRQYPSIHICEAAVVAILSLFSEDAPKGTDCATILVQHLLCNGNLILWRCGGCCCCCGPCGACCGWMVWLPTSALCLVQFGFVLLVIVNSIWKRQKGKRDILETHSVGVAFVWKTDTFGRELRTKKKN